MGNGLVSGQRTPHFFYALQKYCGCGAAFVIAKRYDGLTTRRDTAHEKSSAACEVVDTSAATAAAASDVISTRFATAHEVQRPKRRLV
jgi:hypothetical protein